MRTPVSQAAGRAASTLDKTYTAKFIQKLWSKNFKYFYCYIQPGKHYGAYNPRKSRSRYEKKISEVVSRFEYSCNNMKYIKN